MARNKLLGSSETHSAVDEGKRYPLHLRTTRAMRERLGELASASGRSLAQEVEFRLEASFRDEDLLDAVAKQMAALTIESLSDTLGDGEKLMAGLALTSALDSFENDRGTKWTNKEVRSSLLEYLEFFSKKLAANPPQMPTPGRVKDIVQSLAFRVPFLVPDAPPPTPAELAVEQAAYDRAEAEGRIVGQGQMAKEGWRTVDREADRRRQAVSEAVAIVSSKPARRKAPRRTQS